MYCNAKYIRNNMLIKSLGLAIGGFLGYKSDYASLIILGMIFGWFIGSLLEEDEVDGEKIIYGMPSSNSSYPNFKRSLPNSIRWTRASTVLERFSRAKEGFYVNNFRFIDRRIKNLFSVLASFLAKRIEKRDLHFSWERLKKGSLIIGSMGQGKTVFMLNIMEQFAQTNRRMVIHDTKGEFTEYFYREEKDFILNHLEKRGIYWDFFEDNANGLPVSLILDFFHAYFLAVAGDKGDKFWSTMAALRFEEIFNTVKTDNTIPSEEKMETFIVGVLRYFETVSKGNDKTEQSIATTLQSSFDIFVKMLYMKTKASDAGYKSFSFIAFFESKYKDGTSNDSRLFMHTIEEVSRENLPFVTAFLSLLFKMQLSQTDVTEEQYILYPLDEYLTFFNLLDSDLKKSLHTKARSTGGLLLPAIQYLPESEEDRKNLLSSVENMFLFAITDTDTQKNINDFFGKTKITRLQNSGEKKKPDFREEEIELIDDNIIKMLETGNHISYMPKDRGTLFVGYTRYPKTKKVTSGYIRQGRDVENDFIRFKQNILPKSNKNKQTEHEGQRELPTRLYMSLEKEHIEQILEYGIMAPEGKLLILLDNMSKLVEQNQENQDEMIIVEIDSKQMVDDKIEFIYEEGVWMIQDIDAIYVSLSPIQFSV